MLEDKIKSPLGCWQSTVGAEATTVASPQTGGKNLNHIGVSVKRTS